MSEDRILRLENAMATLAELSADHENTIAMLAELSADHENTMATLAELSADHENTIAMLVELSAEHQRRISRLEESFVTLVNLLQSHQDGMTELRAAQAETDAKLSALADAQIRTEAALTNAQVRTDDALQRLAESQTHTDRRLDTLIDIVRGGRNGHPES